MTYPTSILTTSPAVFAMSKGGLRDGVYPPTPTDPLPDGIEMVEPVKSEIVKSAYDLIVRERDTVDLIFDLSGGQGMICGSFARYCMSTLDEPIVPGDIDLFCTDQKMHDFINDRFEKHPNMTVRSSSQIETKYEYSLQRGFYKRSLVIQLIHPIEIHNMVSVGPIETILDNFDFTVAKCGILPPLFNAVGGTPVSFTHKDFFEHDLENKLVITNTHCPISSMKRVIKYTKRGYSITSKELLKLFKDYEDRGSKWKELITWGLSDEVDQDQESRGSAKWNDFIDHMYLD